MAPGRSRFSTSPRHLVQRHAHRLRAQQATENAVADDTLPPGWELLRSYHAPGLLAGEYTVAVNQWVTPSTSESKSSLKSQGDRIKDPPTPTGTTVQTFEVVAPQFSLPSDAIHSTYPPQGQQEKAQTLPHVIFNVPTFPWARVASETAGPSQGAPTTTVERNRVPWLAVFVFTADEVKLDAQYLHGGSSDLFTNVDPTVAVALGPTMSINLPVAQLANLSKSPLVTVAAAPPDDGTDPQATTDLIFLPKALFTGLFTQRDDTGQPVANWTDAPYVDSHRFLAHERAINTQGMAVAGAAAGEDDTGSFGVVFSNRTGPVDIDQPTVVYVHLVSIEAQQYMKADGQWPIPDGATFVAVPSLYSWSYICLPPSVPDVEDEFETLGASINLLRVDLDNASANILPPPGDVVGDRVTARLQAGYSLARYRTQTGETTACLTRGPFIPTTPAVMPDWWPATSMAGTDLQILDPVLGLMDLSYSLAWQAGRAMAIGDQSFTTALYNVRRMILQRAMTEAQAAAVNKKPEGSSSPNIQFKDTPNLLKSLTGMLDGLQKVRLDGPGGDSGTSGLGNRWHRKAREPLDLSYHGPLVAPQMVYLLAKAAHEVASTPETEHPTEPSKTLYNETNVPFSTDWAAVLKWVLDRLYLTGVPAHYLLTESSHLPPESMRFFTVDPAWVTALVDGALSFGNHVNQQHDPVRQVIKDTINEFLANPGSAMPYPYPVPLYGCYVRSKLVSQFPDLMVQSLPPPATNGTPVLLSHNIVDDGTMLCLFGTPPNATTFSSLQFTQPPHQQTFWTGGDLSAQQMTVTYRRAFTRVLTSTETVDPRAQLDSNTWQSVGGCPGHPNAYLWDDGATPAADMRILLMENLASDYLSELPKKMPSNPSGPPYFVDDTATSALLGFQCNNPSWILPITPQPSLGAPSEGAWAFPPGSTTPKRPEPAQIPSPGARKGAVHGGSIVKKKPPKTSRPPRAVRRHIRLWWANKSPSPPLSTDEALPDTFPQYLYNFWPASAHATPQNPGSIPMRTDQVPQDIVVSITLNSQPFDYFIQEIRILIPLADPKTGTPALATSYATSTTGRSTAMLSNLRLTALVEMDTTGGNLILRLIPRSRSVQGGGIDVPSVPTSLCGEMSFLLPLVAVNVYDQATSFSPTVVETYVNEAPQTPHTVPVINLGVWSG